MSQDVDIEDRVCVIVGLGNPGRLYENTRHNVGFRIVDLVAGSLSVSVSISGSCFVWGRGDIDGAPVFFLKPGTYMNRSGLAVEEFILQHNIPGDRILVIHDDVDLPLGRLRVARKGGAGGHKGVASVIEHLKHQSFPRVKVGIGRPLYGEPVEGFVLSTPYPEEVDLYEETIRGAAEAVRIVLDSGLTRAMNLINGRKLPFSKMGEMLSV